MPEISDDDMWSACPPRTTLKSLMSWILLSFKTWSKFSASPAAMSSLEDTETLVSVMMPDLTFRYTRAYFRMWLVLGRFNGKHNQFRGLKEHLLLGGSSRARAVVLFRRLRQGGLRE